MSESEKNNKRVWLIALILMICVGVTSVVAWNVFDGFRENSDGAIDINGGTIVDVGDDNLDDGNDDVGNNDIGNEEIIEEVVEYIEYHPGFEASDDKRIWAKNTEVEIFNIRYENGDTNITVESVDGSRLIAPGTENSYVFKFKNTGNVAMDYSLTVDAYITGTDLVIPVVGRISRYDGKWITSDNDEFVDVATLDAVKDHGTLGVNRFTYYTFDWMWPFEGDDSFDTLLGNLAVEDDLILTLKLNTVATISKSIGGGIIDTADSETSTIWIISAGLSMIFLIFLLVCRKDDEDNES